MPTTPFELPTSPKLPQDVTKVDRAVPVPACRVLILELSVLLDLEATLGLVRESTEEGSLKEEEDLDGVE